ncbi:MAG: OmpA family protein [Bacteroidia bacterium]|nr:OmpA family protein [Bacteroidia bacterium]
MASKPVLLFVCLFFVSLTSSFSQELSPRVEKKLLKKARYHFNTGSYYKALETYRELLRTDSTKKIYLFEAGLALYYSNFEKSGALQYMTGSQRYSAGDTIPETFFIIAEIQHLNGQFEDALKNYKRYKTLLEEHGVYSDGKIKQDIPEEIDQKIAWCNTGIRLRDSMNETLTLPGDNTKIVFHITLLDSNVNSPFDDYSTLLSPNDDRLYFTTRRKDGIKNYVDFFDIKHFEDIYISDRSGEKWAPSVPLPGQVNTTNRHEATNFLSKDGKTLYLYQGIRTGTMYISTEEGGQWKKPLKIKGAGLNSKHWETSLSFCISNDQIMYFVSDRPGGFGGRDIYTCKKNPDGSWGEPENMGVRINTKYDEDGPYLTPDGKTLYFSSNGPGSMGGFDIFKCTLTNGQWSAPENPGIPVNSTADDIYFHFSHSGKSAFLSSSRLHERFTDMNIYYLEEVRTDTSVLLLAGDTLRGGLTIHTTPPDTFGHPDRPKDTANVLKKPNPPAPSVRMAPPVYFDFDKISIQGTHQAELDQLVSEMKKKPELSIELQGHTDGKGGTLYNENLSVRRVRAVQDYLVRSGIDPSRISTQYFGESQPAFPNTTVENRKKNRRVEILIHVKP